MNPVVQKYAPPLAVIGAALFLGWPPSTPMDLGDDLVKARAVRWKASDLESPAEFGSIDDPFQPVLVVEEKPELVEDQLPPEPVGPSEEQIRAVVMLTGLGNLGGRGWAIINGKARLPGDTVRINGEVVKDCKLLAVHKDHVLVQCQQTYAVVRPQVSRQSATRTTATAAQPALESAAPADPGPPAQSST